MMHQQETINAGQIHSIIYDNSHLFFYKDNYQKYMVWKDIAEALGVDGKSLILL